MQIDLVLGDGFTGSDEGLNAEGQDVLGESLESRPLQLYLVLMRRASRNYDQKFNNNNFMRCHTQSMSTVNDLSFNFLNCCS